MGKKDTIGQHYVPQTYLKHFAEHRGEEHFIKALLKDETSDECIIESNINNICKQRDIYTLKGNTADERMLIESFYESNYERNYNKIYNILIDEKRDTISAEERKLIISTIITMLFRTTKISSIYNKFMDGVLESLYLSSKSRGKDFFFIEKQKVSIVGKTLEQIKRENKKESKPMIAITQLQVALRLIQLRIGRDSIMIIKLLDDNCEYITSDNPVTYSHLTDENSAPFDNDNLLNLPLDSKHLLSLIPDPNVDFKHRLFRVNKQGKLAFNSKLTSNYQQMKNAERFILGNDSSLKGYLKTKEETEKPIPD